MTELSTRTLNRTLLARQLLLRRAQPTLEGAIEQLVGLQAQAPNPPYLGLHTRLESFDPEQLSKLITDRRVLRIALQRNTIHLVTAEDAVLLRRVLKPVIDNGLRHNFGAQLKGVDLAALGARGRALVEQEPLTFARLGELLAEEYPQAAPNALAQGVRQLVPLVQVPPRGLWGRGGAATHTSLESWLGGADSGVGIDGGLDDTASDEELDAVLLRYLAAFGPASVRDMQMWCGLTRLSAVVKRLGERLQRYTDPNGTVLYDAAGAHLADEDEPAPVRLLPEYDNILLSHADRSRILDPTHRSAVFTQNGRILGTVLVDGFVAATWRFEERAGAEDGGQGVLTVEPLHAPTTRARRALENEVEPEAARMLELLAPGGGAQVRFPSK
ncbi:AlkZ family DNA glycosylase [Actinospica durhamensis]|uniref:AlkZ family DNA glycosylase n=1 Tax=Actinospica durhamensis TaxID=1508375 RepID=A0A941EQY8_9ACTN|nr:winged helix DNA-binding domain-containing protein [Actinospica durhamensis]MBR7836342.1 AlkZ family DNA glycosylase [Actinospica durhamensis]